MLDLKHGFVTESHEYTPAAHTDTVKQMLSVHVYLGQFDLLRNILIVFC